ncbi:uncharacterized protein LY79DRAFT_576643 [Colletotrichum navitas]|uniref:Uncharacterized protein n=1 Tax=Colletotrichum navitas TaxID=681940 RepID=A0AAD8Q8N6_9PEZI|nr:uncharacterized protein LY79DRAFT_576643 [Colletotrichum navitas]KAK1597341.1 hypothetical protein LY79DRAFT_576643 [Colletotrichum navitas]
MLSYHFPLSRPPRLYSLATSCGAPLSQGVVSGQILCRARACQPTPIPYFGHSPIPELLGPTLPNTNTLCNHASDNTSIVTASFDAPPSSELGGLWNNIDIAISATGLFQFVG